MRLDCLALEFFGAASALVGAFDEQVVELRPHQPGGTGAFQPVQRFPVDWTYRSGRAGCERATDASITERVVAWSCDWVNEWIVADGTEQVWVRLGNVDQGVQVENAIPAVPFGDIERGDMRRPQGVEPPERRLGFSRRLGGIVGWKSGGEYVSDTGADLPGCSDKGFRG
jgi:hypothetical protein